MFAGHDCTKTERTFKLEACLPVNNNGWATFKWSITLKGDAFYACATCFLRVVSRLGEMMMSNFS